MVRKHVYIVGSKGIPAKYGGFETFVEKLTEYQKDTSIQYHIACMTENSVKSNISEEEFIYNGANCFNIAVPPIGPGRAIYYDFIALKYAIDIAEKNKDIKPVFYVLACRIGPFIANIKKRIDKIDGQLFVNPDGHEWLRSKWSYPVRKYWKLSEGLMVKHSDLIICDSKNIEKYIQEDYQKYSPKTIYIAYGTDLELSTMTKDSLEVNNWYSEKNVRQNEYYLVVGRFVPENNYEVMIREFMKSNTTKDFVLITNVEKNKFYEKLKKETRFDKDSRIKFVGTVYDQQILKYIREKSFAYIHGHEVGGTNPSLLEALSSTKLNLLLGVGFNEEVASNGAIYWNKENNNLKELIEATDNFNEPQIKELRQLAVKRIKDNYNWEMIINNYENIFK